jgi:4a-hydroxytetrahydrobiopterin dehydratase
LVNTRCRRGRCGLASDFAGRFIAAMPTPPLTRKEIKLALGTLPGWKFAKNTLAKEFKFGSFREAMSFMVRAGFEAEAMDHHPDWTNVYNRVAVRLNTHDAGGRVTAKDIALAKRLQQISWVG